jgi:DNA-binding SARP family transcriptional activator
MHMRVKVLGPWELTAGDAALPLTGSRRVSLLARLALSAGQVVTARQLLADVWGDGPTATAPKQLHIVVSKIREHLTPYVGDDVLVTAPGGYRLDLPRDHVDANEFPHLVRAARAAQRQGELAAADRTFRRALALWRGEALTDVTGPWVQIEAARLTEERLTAVEDHVDVRLAQGDHNAVVPELIAHLTEHRLRERPCGQLMLALYRAGRSSEALEAYRETRRVMLAELGLEPGVTLRRLQQAVLRRDPALDLTTPAQRITLGRPPAPAELPAGTPAFIARDLELEQLTKALSSVPAIVAVDGPGGIGKSALAVHLAHTVADRFPDGTIYLDLRGSTPGLQPLSALDCLGRLLRSLGVGGSAVPGDADEAAARFRSLTATRKLLLILDNALDARQVRPLIPAGPGCAVVVTSRQVLTPLDGVHHLSLTGLDATESTSLLARIVGPERVHGEAEAAERIVALCGGLPLALRVAAARLVARPDWTLSHLAERLNDATRRLDLLEHADLAVRASLSVSLRHLREDPSGQDAARLFALLGLLDLPTHTVAATAALTGWHEHRVEEALDSLQNVRLLEPAGPARYRMHDLVRIHAREQAGDLSEPERHAAAVRRVLHHYLATAKTASLLLDPAAALALSGYEADRPGITLGTAEEASDWTEQERDNLVAACQQAMAVQDDPRTAFALVATVYWPLVSKGLNHEVIELQTRALEIAVACGDHAAEAMGNHLLGWRYQALGRLPDATRHLEQALVCWDRANLPERMMSTYNGLGIAYAQMGRFDDALDAMEKGRTLAVTSGRREFQAAFLGNTAMIYVKLGRLTEAISTAQAGVALWAGLGHPFREGTAYDTLANAYRRAERFDDAESAYRKAIELQRQGRYPFGEAASEWGLGQTYHDQGRRAEAWACWRRALAILRDIDLLTQEEVERLLSQDVPETPAPIRNSL